MDQEWQLVKKKLQGALSKGQYDLYVSTVDFLGMEEERLVLGCRNRFHIEWLREKLEAKLLASARGHFPNARKLEYRIVTTSQFQKPEQQPDGPRQISFGELIKRPLPNFNPRFTFDQFVVGSGNQFAYAASKGMVDSQQYYNQSIYLLSQTGLGKSHLSHAVGSYLISRKPDLRVQYVTTEQFANEMVFALKQGTIESFKNKFRTACDVLLLERIEFLSGKEKIQNELVYTLDELMDRGKKVLCTGNAYPKDIPKLSKELQSRLGGILVAPIDPPDFGTRLEIVKRKARAEGVQVPVNVAEFLADSINGDIRQLESCLIGLIAKTNILNLPITLDLAREVTRTMLDRLPKITVGHIQQIVCSTFRVAMEDLISASRRKEIATARKVAMYLSRQYTTESLISIGKAFQRSHSSVLYAVNGMGKEMNASKSSDLKRQVEFVSRRLETSCLSL